MDPIAEFLGRLQIERGASHNTLLAYRDHGDPQGVTVSEGLDAAQAHMDALAAAGISLDEITAELLAQGVASFAASYDKLLTVIGEKMAALSRPAE